MKYSKLIVLLFIIFFCTFNGKLFAENNSMPGQVNVSGITVQPHKFAKLPDFLQARIRYFGHDRSSPEVSSWFQGEYRYWRNRIGPDYQHYHHLAAGFVKHMRAMTFIDDPQKRFLLRSAVREFDYMLRHTSADHFLHYFFHYKKGESLHALGDLSGAADEFIRSINLRKDYVNSYIMLHQVYLQLGMDDRAEQVLKQLETLSEK